MLTSFFVFLMPNFENGMSCYYAWCHVPKQISGLDFRTWLSVFPKVNTSSPHDNRLNFVPWREGRLVLGVPNVFGILIVVTVGSCNYHFALHEWSILSHVLCPVLNLLTYTLSLKIAWTESVYYVYIKMKIKPRLWIHIIVKCALNSIQEIQY